MESIVARLNMLCEVLENRLRSISGSMEDKVRAAEALDEVESMVGFQELGELRKKPNRINHLLYLLDFYLT